MGRPRKDRGPESKFHREISGQNLSRVQKGHISEAAILFRLALHGFESYGSTSDGDKFDWVVHHVQTNRLLRLQVKWASVEGGHGLPLVHLRCANGRGKFRDYHAEEYDFVIAYDLYTDTAYVYPFQDLSGRKTVSIKPEAAERWDLLKGL